MNTKRSKQNKRRARNGRRRPNSSGLMVRSVRQIVPDRLRTTLCYTAVIPYSGSPTAGNVFVGNSLYDPEFAVGGNQPVGYDQLSALYYRYRVLGSRCRVRFVPSTASTTPFFACLYPTNLSTTLSSPTLASQQPYAKDLIVMGQNPTRVTLESKMATNVICGEPPEKVLYDDVYSAAFNASPLSPWYWIATLQSTDGITNIAGNIVVEIWYDAEFYFRVLLAQS